jgi:hypothetical protein
MGVARVGELAKGLLLTGTAYLFILPGRVVYPGDSYFIGFRDPDP